LTRELLMPVTAVDIFDFDISPSGPAKALDMGTCAFETGVTEGKVTAGGKNSEHSFGGGLTYKTAAK
jgi:formamidase